MQLKFMYQGKPVDCAKECNVDFCSRDLLMKVLRSLVSPRLAPVIDRIFQVQELFMLADVVSLGENQLHHVIRICEYADSLSDDVLAVLEISREDLLTAVMFHDVGKGPEVDDRNIEAAAGKPVKVPKILRKCGVPAWVEIRHPIHEHIEKSLQVAETYHLGAPILEAIALHHHVKITPPVLKEVAGGLVLAPMIAEDILHHDPEQYAAKGSNLAQVIAILDQLCAIERKFQGRICFIGEPDKMEDELVKDLVIGVSGPDDPRLKALGLLFEGSETVILLDLRSFGAFVQLHSEYQVQATKREILNTIRSVVRVQDHHRVKDAVGLVGGDEYVVITKMQDDMILEKIIERIKGAVKARTGFSLRVGYGKGKIIPENFHEARTKANLDKKPKLIK
ncbi:MAG: HD domain-containing protein [Bacillota bacterium]